MTRQRYSVSDPTIIELNDSGILMAGADGVIASEPGYARLTPHGIQTGEEALRHAFLEPQRVYHQFWNQLSLAPLNGTHGQARHHADLAYHQLLQLHQAAGQPEHTLFSVPGTFSHEQLSILLGLAQASPFETIGLVDSAVAALAGFDERGEWLHLDLHLHQAVLTRVRLEGERIERLEVQRIAAAGLRALLGNWAQHIAHSFVRQYRYDPLHTAASEQQLHDRMRDWLPALALERDITIHLDSPRGTYSMNLSAESFINSNAMALQSLQQAIHQSGRFSGLVVGDRLARLPRIREQLGAQLALPADIVTRNAYLRREQLGAIDGGLVLHTRLQTLMPQRPTAAGVPRDQDMDDTGGSATHVLFQYRAHPIGQRLYIGFSAAEPTFGLEPPPAPWLCLTHTSSQLTWHTQGPLNISAPNDLTAGSILGVQLPDTSRTHELIFIEVS